ncbi:hypothetical protein K7432_010439 [Basidiobolus ranarum]|uniref:Uncharacterized protein n=1 Tax=Basidiobolus ranarum TaxID=34480 RepID=A0ABR2WNS8_9FUNG
MLDQLPLSNSAPTQSVDALVALPVECADSLSVESATTSPTTKNARATLSRFTRSEVQRLLREAYSIITEKDKEITFAAKLRSRVLEENEILKSKYEEIIDYLSEHGFFVAEPDNSDHVEIMEPTQLQNTPVNTIHPIRPLSRRQSTRFEDESLTELEMINAELQSRLEVAIQDNAQHRKKNERKVRSLEADIRGLRTELEMATQTLSQLEDKNYQLRQRKLIENHVRQHDASDEQFIDQLIDKVSQLEELNASLETQKSDIEERLNGVLEGLEEARFRIEELEETQNEYNELQVAFERQSMHVAELSQSVEEQRSWIQGVFSQHSPRSVPGTFNFQTSLTSPKMDLSSALFGTAYSACNSPAGTSQVSMRKRRTLLSELESEWYRNVTGRTPTGSIKSPNSVNGFVSSTPRGVSVFSVTSSNFNSPASLHSITSPNNSSISTSYLRDIFKYEEKSRLVSNCSSDIPYDSEVQDDQVSDDEGEDSEEPLGWFRWIVNSIKGAVSYMWRWCRFLFLLFTAVVIALCRGPNGDMF